MLLIRDFDFSVDFQSLKGETVTLTTTYRVEFSRFPDSRFTYIVVKPDFAPLHKMKYLDECGVSWGSLFYAFKWCQGFNEGHILDWVKMDMEDLSLKEERRLAGSAVIPVEKLSTITHKALQSE